jgi:lactoylglutathione lyase
MMKKIVFIFFIASSSYQMGFTQNKKSKMTPIINHIAIYVTDLSLSTHFYRNVLGLDTVPEPFHDGRHTWLALGNNCTLHIIQGANAPKEYFKSHHTCFSVASLDDFTVQLKSMGIEYENLAGEKNNITIRTDGVKQIYFKDPDGYWIELNDAKE